MLPTAFAAPACCDINGDANAAEEANAEVAADAALVLLRRFAKVGPKAPFSEIETRCRQLEAANFVIAEHAAECVAAGTAGTAVATEKTMPGPVACEASTQLVCFDFASTTVHEITPYEEVYGLHPREFVFDRHFHMLPSSDAHGFVGFPDDDGEDSELEEVDDDAGVWVQIFKR